jgi:methanogenic corrinoid protein MtbC1
VPDGKKRELIDLIRAYADALGVEIMQEILLPRSEDALAWAQAARRLHIDAKSHLQSLSQALENEEPLLFSQYVVWAQTLAQTRNLNREMLGATLERMEAVFERRVSPAAGSLCRSYIEAGLARLRHQFLPEPRPADGHPMSALRKVYFDALLRNDRHDACRCILRALDRGSDIRDIYLHVFQAALYEVGRLWHLNKITISQEHYCTAVTQSIISQLYPRIFSSERNGWRLVAACAFPERHEIGMRMVCDFFEMEGWDTYYLGTNTPFKNVVEAIVDKKANLLLVSVTMTFHLGTAKGLIAQVRSSKACADVRILVGGYPFNIAPDLWKKIGADGHARDASEAVAVARLLFENKSSAAGACNSRV